MQVYIHGKSKVDVNRRLAKGEHLSAQEYSPFGVEMHSVSKLRDGVSVKVFEKHSGGCPVAKSYGTMKAGRVT